MPTDVPNPPSTRFARVINKLPAKNAGSGGGDNMPAIYTPSTGISIASGTSSALGRENEETVRQSSGFAGGATGAGMGNVDIIIALGFISSQLNTIISKFDMPTLIGSDNSTAYALAGAIGREIETSNVHLQNIYDILDLLDLGVYQQLSEIKESMSGGVMDSNLLQRENKKEDIILKQKLIGAIEKLGNKKNNKKEEDSSMLEKLFGVLIGILGGSILATIGTTLLAIKALPMRIVRGVIRGIFGAKLAADLPKLLGLTKLAAGFKNLYLWVSPTIIAFVKGTKAFKKSATAIAALTKTTKILMTIFSVMSKVGLPLLLLFTKAHKIFTPIFAIFKGVGKFGNAASLGMFGSIFGKLSFVLKLLGKLFVPLLVVITTLQGAYRAFQSFMRGESLSEIITSFFGGIIESLTFGLLSSKRVSNALQWMIKAFMFYWTNVVVPVYGFIWKTIKSIWNFIAKRIFPPIRDVWLTMVKFIALHVVPLVAAIWGFIKAKIFPWFAKEWIKAKNLWNGFTRIMDGIFGWLFDWMMRDVPKLIAEIKVALHGFGIILDEFTKFFKWMTDASWSEIFDYVIALGVTSVKNFLKNIIGNVFNLFETISDAFTDAIDWIINNLKSLVKGILTASITNPAARAFANNAVEAAFSGVTYVSNKLGDAGRENRNNMRQSYLDGTDMLGNALYRNITDSDITPEQMIEQKREAVDAIEARERERATDSIGESGTENTARRRQEATATIVNNIVNQVANGGGDKASTVIMPTNNTRMPDASFANQGVYDTSW